MKRVILFLAYFRVSECWCRGARSRSMGNADPEIRQWYQALMQPDVPMPRAAARPTPIGRTKSTSGTARPTRHHRRQAGRTARPAPRRHRNGDRNPEPQTQMGPIESDRPWHRLPEPERSTFSVTSSPAALEGLINPSEYAGGGEGGGVAFVSRRFCPGEKSLCPRGKYRSIRVNLSGCSALALRPGGP